MKTFKTVAITIVSMLSTLYFIGIALGQKGTKEESSGVDPNLLWLLGGVLLIAGVVVLVVALEKKITKLTAERDAALLAVTPPKTAPATSELEVKLNADTSDFHAAIDSAREKLGKFADEIKEAVPGGAADFWRSTILPMSPPQQLAPQLAPAYIDRDDFMKAMGESFPQPVSLDGKLVHNGMGEILNYYTDSNGQITSKKPSVQAELPLPGAAV